MLGAMEYFVLYLCNCLGKKILGIPARIVDNHEIDGSYVPSEAKQHYD